MLLRAVITYTSTFVFALRLRWRSIRR